MTDRDLQFLTDFIKKQCTLDLVAMRHEAVQTNDIEAKNLIDKELKKRVLRDES